MNITIYGTSTSGHQVIVSTIRKFLDRAQLDYTLNEVSDINVFLQKSIESVPAIQIDDQPIISIKTNGSFNQSLRKTICKMLETKDFGNSPKIISPIDFSEASLNAMMFAHRLSTELDAVLKVIHVYYPSAVEVNEVTYVDRELVELKKEQLEKTIKDIDTDWTGDIMKAALVDHEFRMGFPGDEIISASKEDNTAMIVMATTGDSGVLKKVFGSVSTKVINGSSSPVLLIPEKAGYRKFKNILLACDDIDEDDQYFEFLSKFVKQFDAKMHAVHVEEDLNELQEEQKEMKEELSGLFERDNIEIAAVYGSDIVEGLNAYADKHDIDLIVMSTERRGFFEKIFHHSITKDMAIHTDIPLLILKR
jgi:nucleotide-binding universal stress UspA family protein